MNRELLVGVAVVALAIIGLSAVGLGPVGMRTETEVIQTGPLPEPPRDASFGIVIAKRTEPHSFLGWQWGRRTQSITVQVVLRPECAPLLAGGADPVAGLPGCLGILASGKVTGEGRNHLGDRMVALRLQVSGECFDAVSYGDRFPHPSGKCAQ